MALAVNNVQSNYIGDSDTYTYNAGTGTGRVLIIVIGMDTDSDDVSGITYNGQAMTESYLSVSGISASVQCFYKESPAEGSNTVSVTCTGSDDYCIATFYVSGANTTDAIGTTGVTDLGDSATPSIDITPQQSGSLLIMGVVDDSEGPMAATGGSTEIYDQNESSDIQLGVFTKTSTSTSSHNIACTAEDDDWATGALEILEQASSSSASASLSPSSSPSASPSASTSASPSASTSASVSPSASVSASPSEGYTLYTRGTYVALPSNNDDLSTNYSEQDVTDVSSKNDTRVDIEGSGYIIHQFKNFVGANTTCQVEWEGQSSLATSASIVYLQIYNHNTDEWDTLDSDNDTGAATDFQLIDSTVTLTNYKDGSNVISCRVYQEVT